MLFMVTVAAFHQGQAIVPVPSKSGASPLLYMALTWFVGFLFALAAFWVVGPFIGGFSTEVESNRDLNGLSIVGTFFKWVVLGAVGVAFVPGVVGIGYFIVHTILGVSEFLSIVICFFVGVPTTILIEGLLITTYLEALNNRDWNNRGGSRGSKW